MELPIEVCRGRDENVSRSPKVSHCPVANAALLQLARSVLRDDNHQIAVIGFASVSNEAHHAQEILDTAIRYVESSRPDAEVTAVELDVLPAF